MSSDSRLLAEVYELLKNRDAAVRARAAEQLRRYVEISCRDLNGSQFNELFEGVHTQLTLMIKNRVKDERLGAITAIDRLIDVSFNEGSESKTVRFATALRDVFQINLDMCDDEVLRLAARTLGHLARAGGALTADFVEFEVTRALEWLREDVSRGAAPRRHAAVLILRELADNAPTLFYQKALMADAPPDAARSGGASAARRGSSSIADARFFPAIGTALHDAKPSVRDDAAAALSACLALVAQRKSKQDWFVQIYEFATTGFKQNKESTVHGSLIIISELLDHTTSCDQFMRRGSSDSFTGLCRTVLAYKDHRERLVRRTVVGLVPKLARFERETFIAQVLPGCLKYLLKTMKGTATGERGAAFMAIGKLAQAVGPAMAPQLDAVVSQVQSALVSRSRRPFCPQALTCVALLASVPEFVEPLERTHMGGLLNQIFQCSLTQTLIDALRDLSRHIPSLLATIQHRLVNKLSMVLANKPYQTPGHPKQSKASTSGAAATKESSASSTPTSSIMRAFGLTSKGSKKGSSGTVRSSGPASSSTIGGMGLGLGADAKITRRDGGDALVEHAVTVLALDTLGTFGFGDTHLLFFVRTHVVAYLDHDVPAIRRSAALTALKLLPGESDVPLGRTASVRMIEGVLERLLMVAVADRSEDIRLAVLNSLEKRFDHFLAQAEMLRSLFIALNDEVFEIRRAAMRVVGRLGVYNPAYVLPCLRKTLIQLLTELEFSGNGRQKEDSARLLGQLIQSAHRLVEPYTAPILRTLLPKLRDPNNAVSAAMISTLGEIALVGREQLEPYLDELVPLIIETLQDQSGAHKRRVALEALGRLISSTGTAVTPYSRYPQLLPTLLSLLRDSGSAGAGTSWELRREVLRTMGILGALDPFRHKIMGRLRLRDGGGGAVVGAASGGASAAGSTAAMVVAGGNGVGGPGSNEDSELADPPASSPDYYPTVAIRALIRILRDPSLNVHHKNVTKAIMFIFRSLDVKCVAFLPKVVPAFVEVMRTCERTLRVQLFQHLGQLVTIVKQHIRAYLDDIFELVGDHWDDCLEQILKLVEAVSTALRNEFKIYLPKLMANLLRELANDLDSARKPKLLVLSTLSKLGTQLEGYLFLVIPALLRLVELTGDHSETVEVRRAAFVTLATIAQLLDVSDYASRIVHPTVRVLDEIAREGGAVTSSTAQDAGFQRVRAGVSQLRGPAMKTLCHLVRQLRVDFAIFVAVVDQALSRIPRERSGVDRIRAEYESLVDRVLRNDNFVMVEHEKAVSFAMAQRGKAGRNNETRRVREHMDPAALKRAWEAKGISTPEDWGEWIRRFSVELLRQSPSPSLRGCFALAQAYPPLARELFNAAFVSCWSMLDTPSKNKSLVEALKIAFEAPAIPAEIVQQLLNLAEFMEHDDKALPIDIRILGRLAADKCHAYAKALHYKEVEFHTSPETCIEELISINNQLEQPEAAMGILKYARQHGVGVSGGHSVSGGRASSMSMSASAISKAMGDSSGSGGASGLASGGAMITVHPEWYEKLGRWDDALAAYQTKQIDEPRNLDVTLGRMRCLNSLGEWEQLASLASDVWGSVAPAASKVSEDAKVRLAEGARAAPERSFAGSGLFDVDDEKGAKIASMAARAAWALGDWPSVALYVQHTREGRFSGAFMRAVLSIHRGEFDAADRYIEQSRLLVESMLTPLVGESYNRAYKQVVKVQQLGEMEEIVNYKRLELSGDAEASDAARTHLFRMWRRRIQGCARNIDVWQRLLSVRTLVLPPLEDVDVWLEFASLCRHGGRMMLCQKTLATLGMNPNPNPTAGFATGLLDRGGRDGGAMLSVEQPGVTFAYMKYKWALGERGDALHGLSDLNDSLVHSGARAFTLQPQHQSPVDLRASDDELRVRIQLTLGRWHRIINENDHALASFQSAIKLDDENYKAWHLWALMNFHVIQNSSDAERRDYINPAVDGFFRSIALGTKHATMEDVLMKRGDDDGMSNVLQDILRLLTLWFDYGMHEYTHDSFSRGFNSISIDTWLQVIPQLIARIHTPEPRVAKLLHELLSQVGKEHPQALIYALTVASKSKNDARRNAAMRLLRDMRSQWPELVDQAGMVSRELIRVAILWHEMWHEGLEDASRLYFGERNVEGMLAVLYPLHEMMARGPETLREVSFQTAYGVDLLEAKQWLDKYRSSHNESDLNQAWELYYHVFRRISKQLPQLTALELQYVSPKLLEAQNLKLAVPGTYMATYNQMNYIGRARAPVLISGFEASVHVITSKQRPRKITIRGSDGANHVFLLKGHEDLRLDERVMQVRSCGVC